MSNPTTTIAFRVAKSIEMQIQLAAKANGQSKGDWVRDQVMQALHAMDTQPTPTQEVIHKAEASTDDFSVTLEAQIQKIEMCLRDEIQALTTAIREVAKSHHRDLCTLGQIGLDAQEAIEQRIEAACLDSLHAIERLKQSQRSHKDTLIRAITPPRP